MDQEPQQESVKETRKKLALTFESPDSTGPTTEKLVPSTYTPVRNTLWCNNYVRRCPVSRYTGRQGRLTLPPISEETDKEKKYGRCWQSYQLRLTLSPTVPSGRKLREG